MSSKTSSRDSSPIGTSSLKWLSWAIRPELRKTRIRKKHLLSSLDDLGYQLSPPPLMRSTRGYELSKLCWDVRQMVDLHYLSTVNGALCYVALCREVTALQRRSREASSRSRKNSTKKATRTSRTRSNTSR